MQVKYAEIKNFPIDPAERRDVALTLASQGVPLHPSIAKYASVIPNEDMALLIRGRVTHLGRDHALAVKYAGLADVASRCEPDDVYAALASLDYEAGLRAADYVRDGIIDPVMIVWGGGQRSTSSKTAQDICADRLAITFTDGAARRRIDQMFGNGMAHKLASDPVEGLRGLVPQSRKLVAQLAGVSPGDLETLIGAQ
jgi:hypothetical protein